MYQGKLSQPKASERIISHQQRCLGKDAQTVGNGLTFL
jgi:hypothetical protein